MNKETRIKKISEIIDRDKANPYGKQDIPWEEIAFKTVKETLLCYFADRRRGQFDVHTLDIT